MALKGNKKTTKLHLDVESNGSFDIRLTADGERRITFESSVGVCAIYMSDDFYKSVIVNAILKHKEINKITWH